MEDQKDQTKERYGDLKKNAVKFGKAWVECMVQQYKERPRAGTPKGKPIGLSKAKYRAALLMILYSPLMLSLKEIANVSKVSPGLIRLWRTEVGFKDAIKDACDSFPEQFANTIDILLYEHYRKIGDKDSQKILEKVLFKSPYFNLINFPYGLDDPIIRVKALFHMIPFFNKAIFPTIAKWLKRRIDGGSYAHIFIVENTMMSEVVKDKKTLRKWEIEHLEITKMLIENELKLLIESDPSKIKNTKSFMIALRDVIFRKFDILAS